MPGMCIKKVKNNFVFCFNFIFSVFKCLVTPHARAVSHILSQLTTPLLPVCCTSHFLTSICIWNLYLIVDTDDSIDDISLSMQTTLSFWTSSSNCVVNDLNHHYLFLHLYHFHHNDLLFHLLNV